METRFLESFVTVVECGSMAEAARRLAVTPAAVAQRIRALESEVGAALLKRVGRVMLPTEAGSEILDRGRAILLDVGDLRSDAAAGGLGGELRIGSISTALTGLMPSILKRLTEAAPRLGLFVRPGTSDDLYPLVIGGDLDAAIMVKPSFAVPKTCDWLQLRSEPLVVLAPQADAGRDPHELLRERPFIRYDRGQWGGRVADAYLRKTGVRPRERLELDSLEAIMVMVDAGLGVSLAPAWSRPWPEGVAVACLPLPGPAPHRDIGLLSRRSSRRQRALQALVAAAGRIGNAAQGETA